GRERAGLITLVQLVAVYGCGGVGYLSFFPANGQGGNDRAAQLLGSGLKPDGGGGARRDLDGSVAYGLYDTRNIRIGRRLKVAVEVCNGSGCRRAFYADSGPGYALPPFVEDPAPDDILSKGNAQSDRQEHKERQQ